MSSDAEEERDPQESQLNKIKLHLDRIDGQLQENGGLNCGWEAADHKDYLRLRTKHNGKTMTVAFMTEIMRCVPGLNDDLIREHIARHDKLLELLDRKKELL